MDSIREKVNKVCACVVCALGLVGGGVLCLASTSCNSSNSSNRIDNSGWKCLVEQSDIQAQQTLTVFTSTDSYSFSVSTVSGSDLFYAPNIYNLKIEEEYPSFEVYTLVNAETSWGYVYVDYANYHWEYSGLNISYSFFTITE